MSDQLTPVTIGELRELKDLLVTDLPKNLICAGLIVTALDWHEISPELDEFQVLTMNGDYKDVIFIITVCQIRIGIL